MIATDNTRTSQREWREWEYSTSDQMFWAWWWVKSSELAVQRQRDYEEWNARRQVLPAETEA